MKNLQLDLNKRLLIVETTAVDLAVSMLIGDFFPEYELELICKGSDLTEDIAKGLVNGMYPEHYVLSTGVSQLYRSGIATYIGNPLKAFIEQIKFNGFFWDNPNGEEPIKEYYKKDTPIEIWEKDFLIDHGEWQEAESKTFSPEKCIIFEIL
ncbi:hypothetical protein [Chryseobacterium aureum]|uniref:hypothetical protein n=1 Tax=Chryseobacterium aureum TaxID=2497456 RepID=UPI000F88A0DF|nr:hypothetical protein [Chryseobacterium aureum]